jgi:flavorubredoxin
VSSPATEVSTYWPELPRVHVAPEQIAPDTWLVHQVQDALGAPLMVYLNSVVITGDEPVIIDTGTIANRGQWLDDVFGIVEPDDVRWVFLSHDDIDHTGNLAEVMTRCPNATLVGSWSIHERHSNGFQFPLDRCHWLNNGQSFDAGDRTLRAVRPPLWDSPTTRGLFDESTGVYWGVDAFASPMPGEPVSTVADLDPTFWEEGMAMFAYHALAPYLPLLDLAKFRALCDEIQALGATTIATAHSPLITEPMVDQAFALMRRLPEMAEPPCPDHAVLEAIVTGMAPAT